MSILRHHQLGRILKSEYVFQHRAQMRRGNLWGTRAAALGVFQNRWWEPLFGRFPSDGINAMRRAHAGALEESLRTVQSRGRLKTPAGQAVVRARKSDSRCSILGCRASGIG
jgi:hypothetical protein